jgi:cob(I)alamin adenosyltransferase
VLPGGSRAAAALHLCRTVARRAERLVVALAANEPVNPEALHFINRLSDFFFVAARRANDNGSGDVLWQPGMNR